MGKRAVVAPAELQHYETSPATTRSIRKRKLNAAGAAVPTKTVASRKTLRMNTVTGRYWHENDDEDSSSNDAVLPQTPLARPARNHSNKQANNSSILLNSSLNSSLLADTKILNESPKPVYTLHPSVVNGTVLHDLMRNPWRLGRPIGKGNFGEIFLASDNVGVPVTNDNAKFVVKIEPHSNGPLFVEIHCLINTAKKTVSDTGEPLLTPEEIKKEEQQQSLMPPTGIPNYIASGSHYFGNARYRFLVLQRFDRDLHSLIKNCRVHQKSVLTLALQIINVLENLHNKGYCHNDIKAQNLMISKCKFLKDKTSSTTSRAACDPLPVKPKSSVNLKSQFDEHYEEKQQTTDSGNSSEQETNEDEFSDFAVKQRRSSNMRKHDDAEDEDEDFDDGATSNSNNSNSMDNYKTPTHCQRGQRNSSRKPTVEFSGSNPVRSCRRQKRNFMYEEMVKSHYLRPTKRVSYTEFFNEDGLSMQDEPCKRATHSSDDESEEFNPKNKRRSKKTPKTRNGKRITRTQEKQSQLKSNKSTGQANSIRCEAAPQHSEMMEEERIFLIDYGLASKFMDNGVHRPFVMDQRRAHDGTLEFTSRDAHMGAHSRRSDLESLGYNLLFWSQGYLPWKEAATQHQQEKVHQAKEYLMTDVREMLKLMYGKQVPKYLGEFLHMVGQLAYHDRPDYARYRRLFEAEFQQLGYKLSDLRLNSSEMVATCVQVNEEIENKNDILEMSKHTHNAVAAGMFRNVGAVGTPFHERSLTNRVSPKNLRSKSDKKLAHKKKFSWAEVLSQDPDQIARERAEKEYDREQDISEVPIVRHYEGRPTYAILEIQRLTGRAVDNGTSEEMTNRNGSIEEEDEEEDVEMAEKSEEDEDDDDDEEMEDEEESEGSSEEYEGAQDEDDDEEIATDNEEDDQCSDSEGNDNEDYEEEDNSEERYEEDDDDKATTRKKRGISKVLSKKSTRQLVPKSTLPSKRNSSAANTKARINNNKNNNTTTTSKTIVKRNKRGRATIASAAGEVEQQQYTTMTTTTTTTTTKTKYVENVHSQRKQKSDTTLVYGERRTRRCVIKTDAAEVIKDEDSVDSVDNRAQQQQLYNVWNQMDRTETDFCRGTTATTVSRRYRK